MQCPLHDNMPSRHTEPPLIRGMRELRDNPGLVDVVVTVEGREFPCHKLILAATSDFFRVLFESGMKEAIEGKVNLKDISPEIFETVLRWMYFYEEILTDSNMYDVTSAANQLQIKSLISEGKQFLAEKINITSCVRILYHSKLLQWDNLEQTAWNFLLKNFDVFCQCEINSLSAGDFKQLVSNTRLVTLSEDSVIQRILEWVEADQDSDSPETEQRMESLAELIKSCRYLLVSLHFLWQNMESNPHVQADPRCRELVREILRYKTQLDLHQQWCPQPAIHRRSSKRRNSYLIFCEDNKIPFISFDGKSIPLTLPNFHFVYPRLHTGITGVAYHNGVLYIEACNARESKKYLYVGNSNIKLSCCNETVWSFGIRTVAFLPEDHSLIAMRASVNNKYYIERMGLPCGMSTGWSSAGRPETQGRELAHVTNVGPKLLMFWKFPDSLSLEWFDLEKQKSCIPPDRLDQVSSVATFRTADQMFVLQDDGVLWRMSNLREAYHNELVQDKILWTGKYTIYGAIVVNKTLFVVKNSKRTDLEIDWSEDRVDDIFDDVYTIHKDSKPIYCIHAVLRMSD